jgi:hypothetical protein
LVFNEGPTKEQAKAAAEEVWKDALANVSNWCHMQSYKKVKSIWWQIHLPPPCQTW